MRIIVFLALMISINIKAQIKDIDGQNYKTVVIGSQTWASENLNVSSFRNGDKIQEAKTIEEWRAAGKNQQPAWCYYENNEGNGKIFGKLYNWYAVNDTRGLVPNGCHIPTNKEWTDLINSQGGESSSVSKFKSTSEWGNSNGTNETGLSILPGGIRFDNGNFSFKNVYGVYWSSTPSNSFTAYYRYFDFPNGKISQFAHDKSHGFSVRYIIDNMEELKQEGVSEILDVNPVRNLPNPIFSMPEPVKCLDNQGRQYKTVVIGSQTWMAENLNVSTFRNGDIIPEAKTHEEWEKAITEKKPAWCYYWKKRSY